MRLTLRSSNFRSFVPSTSTSTGMRTSTSYSSAFSILSAWARVTGAPSMPHTRANFMPPEIFSMSARRSTRSARSSPTSKTTERSPVARTAK